VCGFLVHAFLARKLRHGAQVVHRPSIGRYTKLEEPKARESLLTPSMRHSASKSSLSAESTKTAATTTTASSSTLSVDVNLAPPGGKPGSLPSSGSGFSPLPMLHAANIALMERTPFAIDDAKDDEDESDEDLDGGENDDQVMDEVRLLFLFFSP
jgi:hypothetical protein